MFVRLAEISQMAQLWAKFIATPKKEKKKYQVGHLISVPFGLG